MKTRFFISVLLMSWFTSHFAFAQQSGVIEFTGSTKEIFGEETASTFLDIIAMDEPITWEIQIPESYDPKNPPGVMVYISPQNIINIPRGWLDLMKEQNLIWIAARESGNKIFTTNRVLYALAGLQHIQNKYTLNLERIYVSGFSGGGRVASMVATQYPQIFKGAIYNCGVNFWNNISDAQLSEIVKNRFVFITGTDDFNLNDTKQVYSKYKKADVKNIDLMIIPRMGHENPRKNRFSKAIDFLDQE